MAAPETKATNQAPAKRRERTNIGQGRMILEVKGKEAGFHYAWIPEDMVHERTENGFEHVRHPVQVGGRRIDVSQMQGSFVTRNLGRGLIGYLMRIPQEFYDEDMELEAQRVDEQERARVRDISSDGLSGTIKVKT